MRRLPVFFVVDVSESMVGEQIKAVQNGLQEILSELRSDPYALETVYMSVLIFAGKAQVAEKLTELTAFQPPVLPIGSGTSLGAALDLLMKEIIAEVKPTTRECKGDWKPLVFLFTDGTPTDNPQKSIERWNRDFRKRANLVAVSFGSTAHMGVLGSLTDDVLLLNDTGRESFREFFKWVSGSIQVSSMAVSESGSEDLVLDRIPNINLEKADTTHGGKVDENFVILVNRCGRKGTLFLSKFAKDGNGFCGTGAWVVDEELYNSLGGGIGSAAKVDTGLLDALPACPVCGNDGLVHCGKCGGLSCYDGRRQAHCSWCGQESAVQNCNNFSIDRARG